METKSITELVSQISYQDAKEMFELLRGKPTWIHRRVEAIQLDDRGATRRKVSVDVTVPEVFSRYGFMPVARLKKTPLFSLDVISPAGQTLSTFTSEQNEALAVKLLTSFNEDTFDSEEKKSIIKFVGKGSDMNEGKADALLQFIKLIRESEDEKYLSLAVDLIEGFLFCVTLPSGTKPGERIVVKFSYEDELDESKIGEVSFQKTQVTLDWASSCHFEVSTSSGLKVKNLSLNYFDDKLKEWRILQETTNIDKAVRIDHLVCKGSEDNRGDFAIAYNLSPERSGLPIASLLASAFTFLVYLVALLDAWLPYELTNADAGSAVSLLAVIPAFLLTWLARNTEHEQYSRLVIGARISLFVNGVLLYLLAIIATRIFSNLDVYPALLLITVLVGLIMIYLIQWFIRVCHQ